MTKYLFIFTYLSVFSIIQSLHAMEVKKDINRVAKFMQDERLGFPGSDAAIEGFYDCRSCINFASYRYWLKKTFSG